MRKRGENKVEKDFYDSNMPNVYIPDIQMPNMSVLEPAFSATNMIAQSVNIFGISGSLTTAAPIVYFINIYAFDIICKKISMIKDLVDTSAIIEIDSSVISKDVDTTFMLEALDVKRTLSDSIGNIFNSFAGIDGLVTYFANILPNAMTKRIQEILMHAHKLVHMMIERLREFVESIIAIVLPLRQTQSACIAIASRTTIFNVPPVKIKFRDFSPLIRKTYLPHARERGSSDDDDINLVYLCN